MATAANLPREKIGKENKIFSMFRVTIETPFYGNNVCEVSSLREAYKLAKSSPGTIVTDYEVFQPEKIGLDERSKVLLFNDGAEKGRCAAARRIIGSQDVNPEEYASKLREAVYNTRYKKMLRAKAYIGLDPDFMVKANLLVPEGHENILYNWLLNFQALNEVYSSMYLNSKSFDNEGDIFVFSDPDWSHPEHPLGLAFFDPAHNCAAILGMRYFGEFKKGTLTLAWGIANRNGFASCHGGQKRYNLGIGKSYVAGFFGLSGSGKSTLTHAKHNGKFDVTVLHDDAFVISTEDGSSVALEPSYFDKTADYPTSSEDNKFLISVQNNAATIDNNGKIVVVTEDIRNGNGRAIKSRLWSPNREDKFFEPVNSIFWLMKDPTLPPILKINGPILSSVMGATLATKRSSAERLAPGVDPEALVFEPYANPFRTYPLSDDYFRFKNLFEKNNVDCYILNTGHFMEKKIPKEITLEILEKIVEGKAVFERWNNFINIEILNVEGYVPDLSDINYIKQSRDRINDRVRFIESKEKDIFHSLPEEALSELKNLREEI